MREPDILKRKKLVIAANFGAPGIQEKMAVNLINESRSMRAIILLLSLSLLNVQTERKKRGTKERSMRWGYCEFENHPLPTLLSLTLEKYICSRQVGGEANVAEETKERRTNKR